MNFIVVELGDNDYGHNLREALRDLIDETGGTMNFDTFTAKKYIIEHILSKHLLRDILEGRESDVSASRVYLNRMKITFRDRLPTYEPDGKEIIDYDGGSAYYDTNLDKVFTF